MKNSSIVTRLLQTLLVGAITLTCIVTLGMFVPLIVTTVFVIATGDSFMECIVSTPFVASAVIGIVTVVVWFIRTIMKIKIMKDL